MAGPPSGGGVVVVGVGV